MYPEGCPYHCYPLPMILPQAQSLQQTQKHGDDGLGRWERVKLIHLREFSQLHQQWGQLEGYGDGERMKEGEMENVGSYHQSPSSSLPHEGKEAGEALVVLGIQEVEYG